jgi:hypothetical protein
LSKVLIGLFDGSMGRAPPLQKKDFWQPEQVT